MLNLKFQSVLFVRQPEIAETKTSNFHFGDDVEVEFSDYKKGSDVMLIGKVEFVKGNGYFDIRCNDGHILWNIGAEQIKLVSRSEEFDKSSKFQDSYDYDTIFPAAPHTKMSTSVNSRSDKIHADVSTIKYNENLSLREDLLFSMLDLSLKSIYELVYIRK